jgi:hypothetical protein
MYAWKIATFRSLKTVCEKMGQDINKLTWDSYITSIVNITVRAFLEDENNDFVKQVFWQFL